jgi:hypothetical protein
VKPIHWLAANWQTHCGLILGYLPLVPFRAAGKTVAATERGLDVTYVAADVTCGRVSADRAPSLPGAAVMLRWPRGRYNGSRIVGVEAKFCIDFTWWGFSLGSVRYSTAFTVGPVHMWFGAVYER